MSLKNKKIKKILHIASFSGNIGDFANHQGFSKKFKKNIPAKFSQIEIRKFYKNRAEMKFDDKLIKLINKHDLLILGGGAFFDIKWDYSSTGTTIDFSENFIKKIKIPVLINGMGYHEFGKVKKRNITKFKNFLKIVTKNKNWLISLRNDGSFERMNSRYGNLTNQILKVPDGGFSFYPQKYSQFYLDNKKNTTWIGLNITNDLFNKSFNKDLDTNTFNKLISQFINQILETNNKVILFPHTYQDINTISIIMSKVDDKHRREKIVIAPFFTEGKKPIEQIFDLYRICSCVIGMRFHTNVCCISMNIPTIGLAGHEQISSLYDELGLSDRCIKINNVQFVNKLSDKLNNSLNTLSEIKKEYAQINNKLDKQSELYHKKIKNWINQNLINN